VAAVTALVLMMAVLTGNKIANKLLNPQTFPILHFPSVKITTQQPPVYGYYTGQPALASISS